LQHLLGFDLPGVAEKLDQQRAHLPAVAHLFDHDPGQRRAVIIAGRALKQPALLLHAGKFSVALVDDQIHQRIAHVLCWDLAQVLPLAPAFVGAEMDFFGLNGAIEGVEMEILDLAMVHADFLAPLVEQAYPVTERSDFGHFTRHEKAPSSSEIPNAKREGSLSSFMNCGTAQCFTSVHPGVKSSE